MNKDNNKHGKRSRIILIVISLLSLICVGSCGATLWQSELVRPGQWIECDVLSEVYAAGPPLAPMEVTGLELINEYAFAANPDEYRLAKPSPNMQFLAVTASGYIDVWDMWGVRAGEKVFQIDVTEETISGLAWSSDGQYLAYGLPEYESPKEMGKITTIDWANRVAVWDVDKMEEVLLVEGAPGSVNNFDFIGPLYFSPDDSLLIAQSGDGFYVWDRATGETLCQFDYGWFISPRLEGMLFRIGWRTDSSPLIAGSLVGRGIPTNSTTIWDTGKKKSLLTIDTDEDLFIGSAFSPNSRFVALTSSGDYAYGESHNRVTVWDIPDGNLLMTLNAPYVFVDWGPDEEKILVKNDTALEIWDVISDQLLTSIPLPESPIVRGEWSNDGGIILIVLSDGTIQFWAVR